MFCTYLLQNGTRRRTPGGVYIQLVKSDPDISKEQLDQIFEEDKQLEYTKQKKKIQYVY